MCRGERIFFGRIINMLNKTKIKTKNKMTIKELKNKKSCCCWWNDDDNDEMRNKWWLSREREREREIDHFI